MSLFYTLLCVLNQSQKQMKKSFKKHDMTNDYDAIQT